MNKNEEFENLFKMLISEAQTEGARISTRIQAIINATEEDFPYHLRPDIALNLIKDIDIVLQHEVSSSESTEMRPNAE